MVVNLTGNYTTRFLLVSYSNVFTTRIWEVWVETCHVALQGVLPNSVFPRVSASGAFCLSSEDFQVKGVKTHSVYDLYLKCFVFG